MMSVKAERAKERELKRLPARDREKPSHVHSYFSLIKTRMK
jgi:hypothetical protein